MKSTKTCLVFSIFVLMFFGCLSEDRDDNSAQLLTKTKGIENTRIVGLKNIKNEFAHTVLFWLKDPEDTITTEKFNKNLTAFIGSSCNFCLKTRPKSLSSGS